MMRKDIVSRRETLLRVWLKTSYGLNIYEISLLSPSRMSYTAILTGEILTDVATGQKYKLKPTEQDLQEGIWEYHPQADGGNWHYIIRDGIKYAVNGCFLDWDGDMVEWCVAEMGQWPFGNQLSEEEVFLNEVEEVLFSLECYLENEIEWMDALEDLENEAPPEDVDSDVDETSEDEGYHTSPEVDFNALDYWALGLNSFLWRIDLYKEGEDGFWTL